MAAPEVAIRQPPLAEVRQPSGTTLESNMRAGLSFRRQLRFLNPVELARVVLGYQIYPDLLNQAGRRLATAFAFGGAWYSALLNVIQTRVVEWSELFDHGTFAPHHSILRSGEHAEAVLIHRTGGIDFLHGEAVSGYDPTRNTQSSFDEYNLRAGAQFTGVSSESLAKYPGGYFFGLGAAQKDRGGGSLLGIGSMCDGVNASLEYEIPAISAMTLLAAACGQLYCSRQEWGMMNLGTYLFDKVVRDHPAVQRRFIIHAYPDTDPARAWIARLLRTGYEINFELGTRSITQDDLSHLIDECEDWRISDVLRHISATGEYGNYFYNGREMNLHRKESFFLGILGMRDSDAQEGLSALIQYPQVAQDITNIYAATPGTTLPILRRWRQHTSVGALSAYIAWLDRSIQHTETIADRFLGKTLRLFRPCSEATGLRYRAGTCVP